MKSKSHPEWATRAWDELVHQTRSRRTLTYTELDTLIGYNSPQGIGRILEHIYHLCKQRNLPPLTVITVSKTTGSPSHGMGDYADSDFERVYSFDWNSIPTPSAAEFDEAFRAGQGKS